MATLQESGRIALAIAVASQPIHLAWGHGSPAWDAAPQPEGNTNAGLVDEIGRRASTQVGYCRPDVNGEIELASGRYTLSAEPTTFVYVKFVFAFAEAAGETIREQGSFWAPRSRPACPPGSATSCPQISPAPAACTRWSACPPSPAMAQPARCSSTCCRSEQESTHDHLQPIRPGQALQPRAVQCRARAAVGRAQ